MRAFGEALEVVPYTLAENAGLQAISIVTELRNRPETQNAGLDAPFSRLHADSPWTSGQPTAWNDSSVSL